MSGSSRGRGRVHSFFNSGQDGDALYANRPVPIVSNGSFTESLSSLDLTWGSASASVVSVTDCYQINMFPTWKHSTESR